MVSKEFVSVKNKITIPPFSTGYFVFSYNKLECKFPIIYKYKIIGNFIITYKNPCKDHYYYMYNSEVLNKCIKTQFIDEINCLDYDFFNYDVNIVKNINKTKFT